MMNTPLCKLQREGRTLLQGHQGCATSMDPRKENSGAAAPMKLLLLCSTKADLERNSKSPLKNTGQSQDSRSLENSLS